jgi:hypothetical protein
VGLERSPLSLVSTTEELLEGRSSGSGVENRDYSLRASAAMTARNPSTRKSLHYPRRQEAVAQSDSLVDSGHGEFFDVVLSCLGYGMIPRPQNPIKCSKIKLIASKVISVFEQARGLNVYTPKKIYNYL